MKNLIGCVLLLLTTMGLSSCVSYTFDGNRGQDLTIGFRQPDDFFSESLINSAIENHSNPLFYQSTIYDFIDAGGMFYFEKKYY